MYICICKGITEEMLERAAKGSKNPKEVMKKLHIGDDCGVCILSALEKFQLASKNSTKQTKK